MEISYFGPVNYFDINEYDNEKKCIEILKDEIFVTTLNPIELKRIMEFIKFRRAHELEMIHKFSGKHFTGLPLTKKKRIQHFIKKRENEFNEFDKIELLCLKQYEKETKHLNLPDEENKKYPKVYQIALIIYFLNKSRELELTNTKRIRTSFRENLDKLGFTTISHNTTYTWYNYIGNKEPSKNRDYYNPMTKENIEIILPFLEKYPIAKQLAENKIYQL